MRFQKRLTLFPGLRLNFSLRGVSLTAGPRGASVNIGPSGSYLNVGLPGTGLSSRTRLSGQGAGNPRAEAAPSGSSRTSQRSMGYVVETAYVSKPVGSLTSPSFLGVRELFAEVEGRRRILAQALDQASAEHARSTTLLERRKPSFLAAYERAYLDSLARHVATVADIRTALEEQLDGCVIDVAFGVSPGAAGEFSKVVDAFDTLAGAAVIWDVSRSVERDRAQTRSFAAHEVHREPVTFGRASDDVIAGSVPLLRLGNVNGGTIIITPAFVLVRDATALDVIDLRALRLTGESTKFVEEGTIPADTLELGETWEKVNKDGSQDRRFKGNRSIPLVQYGTLRLTTDTGLNEHYLVSNSAATVAFTGAFKGYQGGLGDARATSVEPGAADADDDLALPELNLPNLPPCPQRPLGPRAAVGLIVAMAIAGGLSIGQFTTRIQPAAEGGEAAVASESRRVKPEQAPTATAVPFAPATSKASEMLNRSLTRSEIAEAQRLLASSGFDPGTPDGRPGARTVAAANRFRVSAGLAATKEIDLQTLLALRRGPPAVPSKD